MGRFGNVILVNGETDLHWHGGRRRGRAPLPGQHRQHPAVQRRPPRRAHEAGRRGQRPLRAGDVVDDVLLAPSERAVVDVLFDAPGEVRLEHRTPDRTYDLGAFTVAPARRARRRGRVLRHAAHRPRPDRASTGIEHELRRTPDKVLAFVSMMPLLYGEDAAPAEPYACPMHPEVTATEPTTMPEVGSSCVPDAPRQARRHMRAQAQTHGAADGAEATASSGRTGCRR